MEGLMILRKIRPLSPGALEYVFVDEGDKPWFPEFVDNDQVRDDAINQEIVANTQGFAVATQDGQVLKKFRELSEAEEARANARPSFEVVNVELDGEEQEFDE